MFTVVHIIFLQLSSMASGVIGTLQVKTCFHDIITHIQSYKIGTFVQSLCCKTRHLTFTEYPFCIFVFYWLNALYLFLVEIVHAFFVGEHLLVSITCQLSEWLVLGIFHGHFITVCKYGKMKEKITKDRLKKLYKISTCMIPRECNLSYSFLECFCSFSSEPLQWVQLKIAAILVITTRRICHFNWHYWIVFINNFCFVN